MTSPTLSQGLTFSEGFERQASRYVSTTVAIDNSPHGPIEIHLSVGATRWGEAGDFPAPTLHLPSAPSLPRRAIRRPSPMPSASSSPSTEGRFGG